MKITRQQIRRIIKESLSEALPPHLQKHFRDDGSSVHSPQVKDVTPAGYGPLPEADEFQNHILAIGLDQAGELVVQDVVDYQSQTKAPRPLEYDEILEIMRDMVDTGMLTDGYGDFFSVHPDYIQ